MQAAAAQEERVPCRFLLSLPHPQRAAALAGARVLLVGDAEELGAWDAGKGVELARVAGSEAEWEVEVALPAFDRINYRYCLQHSPAAAPAPAAGLERSEGRDLSVAVRRRPLTLRDSWAAPLPTVPVALSKMR